MKPFQKLSARDRMEFTDLKAMAALDARFRIDHMRLFAFASDGANRTDPGAGGTPDAFRGVDAVTQQVSAFAGPAFLFLNVLPVFVSKVTQAGLHRIGGRLPETA
jgi:hypothetical protein